MQDRFKFRCYNKFQEKMFEVKSMSYIDGIVKRIEVQDEERILIFDEWQNNIDNTILMQCTGLKDKNGKLIYEGDILKFGEFYDDEWHSWDIGKVYWGGKFDYPAFEIQSKATDFDTSNGLSFIFGEGLSVEVIGNIYENPELIKEGE